MYAGTWGPSGLSGGRVYRYESGTTWTEISPPDGLADAVWDLEWFEGELWATTHVGPESTLNPNTPHGTAGFVWRWDGTTWTEASPVGGFGSAATTVSVMNGQIYVTVDQTGLLRWEGARDWTLIASFRLPAQAIVSATHDGREMLYMGQDNSDEFWFYDPDDLVGCGTFAGLCTVPVGPVCSAECHVGSCIHAFTEFDDGGGSLVWAGAWNGKMYHWNPATHLMALAPNVPTATNVHVQGLASYHDLLYVGLSDGKVRSSPDGQTATYALEQDFADENPVSDMLAVPSDDLLWVGFGGVPWRWARRVGLSAIRTFDGAAWVDRSDPGQFGVGVLTMLAVVPEVHCDAGAEQTFECTGQPIEVVLDGSGSTWSQGFAVTFEWSGDFTEGTASGPTPTVHFEGTGDHAVTLTVSVRGASESCTTVVHLVDTVPPVATGTGSCLWPPNHRYRCFTAAQLLGAADPAGPPVADDTCEGQGAIPVRIVAASSSQPEDVTGNGDGSTQDDILFDDDGVCVRSERQGDGRPRSRFYTVVLEAVDAAGNVGQTTATLRVPHDQRVEDRCRPDEHDVGLLPHAPLPLGPDVQEGTYPAP
jgi:hypothetical protein